MLFDFFGGLGEKVDSPNFTDTLAEPFNDDDLNLLYGIGNVPASIKKDITLNTPSKSSMLKMLLQR